MTYPPTPPPSGSNPGGNDPYQGGNPGQYGQPGSYGQPGGGQYGQPGSQPGGGQYGQPGGGQYGQPGNQPGGGQYGQPGGGQYGQPGGGQYGQPNPGQYGQPSGGQYGQGSFGGGQYGAPQGGQSAYGNPQYGAPGGYPGGPGTPQKVDVGTAFSWSWSQFTSKLGVLILPGIALIVGMIVLYAVAFGALLGSTNDDGTASGGGMIGFFLVYFLIMVLVFVIQVGLTSGVLKVADGANISVADVFVPRNLGPAFLTTLLVIVGVLIGSIVFIGGIIVMFFCQFAMVYAIDKGLSPVDAIKASFELVKNNIGDAVIMLLVVWAISFVGALLCGIGMIAALPVAQLFLVHCYRRLTGGPIAPVAGAPAAY
ncbi:hypothetical protein GII30_03625 [Gordonia amarae]|uniref:Integral membrane protein n=2 Tax=Gordonia amarae TaxID=36821 RepID=G7GUC6_9ACTN|nr:hypothetical protein [Gordonia amarae]MCS3877453.1 putative membrane protein [Gordonia amarae]QHN16190.1 hypothetical protein GII35_03630 [Gordonia amarae]QHN20759.1 hypothetical protein GII34_03630 [Gordonia amarae]QHN29611.1 hypothetical protein GII32_03635 [Gordonia amarae]QHN38386.1 hypothetical protein GII30_03625 [Gordonia amarae]